LWQKLRNAEHAIVTSGTTSHKAASGERTRRRRLSARTEPAQACGWLLVRRLPRPQAVGFGPASRLSAATLSRAWFRFFVLWTSPIRPSDRSARPVASTPRCGASPTECAPVQHVPGDVAVAARDPSGMPARRCYRKPMRLIRYRIVCRGAARVTSLGRAMDVRD
jgi:hypothetical protein